MISYFLLVLTSLTFCNGQVVTTKNGQLKGSTISILNQPVHQFLGIRYAQPPIGQLRFKKPEPVKNWTGVLPAIKKTHSCWQSDPFNSLPEISADLNEDCLFLNVWSKNLTGKQPVMFWIHGGGYNTGSSYDKLLNASALATFDVVAVTINYRLGPFGFIYDGTKEAPGNMGTQDQVLAMKWVKDNIKSFGGDPDNITIFGESAGGLSVGLHLVSPLSQNLFRRAIIQSGAPYFPPEYIPTKEKYLNVSKKYADGLGCSGRDWLSCLKKLPSKRLLGSTASTLNSVILDNDLLTTDPKKALKAGKYHSNTEILTGATADEGTLALLANYWWIFMNPNATITKARIRQMLNEMKTKMREQNNKFKYDVDKIYNRYIANQSESNQIQLKRAFAAVIGDPFLKCPTYFYAKLFADLTPKNSVYFYNFKHKGKKTVTSFCREEWMGICHAEDVPLVIGHPVVYPTVYTKEDYQFSMLAMTLWTNFAKNGNPTVGRSMANIDLPKVNLTSVRWPSFSRGASPVMQLGPKDFGTVLVNPYENTCEDIWRRSFDPEEK